MKKLFVLIFLLPAFAGEQTTHTVGPKETLYSLARKYNIHPKDLAAYNNIPVETGLEIGQVIKIPPKGNLKSVPPSLPKKESAPATSQTGEAVYHKVEKKETLYHISKTYNVSMDDIKKWNHLSSEGLTEGVELIVGFKNGTKPDLVVTTKPSKDMNENRPVVPETVKQPV